MSDLGSTNIHFNNFANFAEQTLLEDLIIEAIAIYGQDMLYIPRRLENLDKIYGQSDVVSFNKAYSVPLYIETVDGFAGDGNFLSKFGMEIRDQVTFVLAKRVFDNIVKREEPVIPRPQEGDLIYLPLNDKCFQIKYTNNKAFFYQLGALQTYQLTCELFEYSNEEFNTGYPQIDKLQVKHSSDILDYALKDENGDFILDEDGAYIMNDKYAPETINPLDDTNQIQEEANTILNWNESNPFSLDEY